ncbi:MAG TPA: tetratricopeptide repeat protein, partial [Vicinamibacterales bacterium]|nr:tetratricopeptide repeat protein [Vicinamibacterales bacterium]
MEASLRRMKKPDDTRVDARLAREIAQREGVKLVLAPSIGEVGGVYLLSAALVDPVRGTALRAESARAHSRREIFDALDNLTQQIRADLGEVSSSIASEAKPLSQVTTSSLDALKMFSLGQQRARAGKFDEARALYERALEIDPRFTAARGSLGMIEFEFVDRKAGRDLLTQAVAEADNLTDVEQYTSKAFYATIVENDLPKAVDAWRALLALYPDVGTAHNNLGRVYLLMKRYEDASSAFSKAIELDPYLMPSYFNLEEIYLEHEGDPEAALELCKKQLMYNDQDVWAYVHSGEAYLGLDRLEDAREAFEHALALGPAYVDVLKPLGSTYRLLGRYQDALRTFRRVQEVDERQVVADYDAGIVYSLIGDEAEARRSFDRFRRSTERLAANGPRDARYVFDLALVWSRLGDRTRGWSLAQTASGLDRTHYYDLARVLAVQGRTGPALRMLDLAVKEGFRDIIRMKIDPDLASLAKTPNFQELVATRHHPPPSREPRPF